MSTIFPLRLPQQAKITGALRTSSNVRNLLQDMLQIELGNVVIDVGWYPDWNPNGEYRLTVFRDSYNDPIEPQLRTTDVRQIANAIYDFVEKYSPRVFTSGSGASPVSFVVVNQIYASQQRLIDVAAAGSSVSLFKVNA